MRSSVSEILLKPFKKTHSRSCIIRCKNTRLCLKFLNLIINYTPARFETVLVVIIIVISIIVMIIIVVRLRYVISPAVIEQKYGELLKKIIKKSMSLSQNTNDGARVA